MNFDPNLSERTQEIYQRNASDWDRTRAKVLFERSWLDRLTSITPENAEILDLGCGAGDPIARHFIDLGYQVTGVDFASAMLAIAAKNFVGVDWVEMDMRSLDLPKKFDAIVAWNSFFHLTRDEQRSMFPLFAKHLKSKGRVLVTTGPADGEAIGTVAGETIYHSSLAAQEYESLFASVGMSVVHHVAEDPECNSHTVWLAQKNA